MEEEGEGGAPDLRDYGRTLWRQRWLILVTVALCVGAALGFSQLQNPVYEATAEVIIQPSGTQQLINGNSQGNAQDAARNVDTETAVLESRVVRDAAERRLGHEPDVTISSSATSDVVSISAQSASARRAARDANAYAASYVALRRKQNIDDLVQAGQEIKAKIAEIDGRLPGLDADSAALTTAEQQRAFLQQQLDQLQVSANLSQVGGARILARAEVPDSPIVPKPVRYAAIALVLGMVLGIGLAFLRDYLDDSVNSRDELERATFELPVLGQIPQIPGWKNKKTPYLVSIDAPSSAAAEAFRTLRTSVQFLAVDRPMNRIQVTSSRTGDGKTTTAANLGVALARAGRKVTIICCDLRRPRLHQFFNLANEVGFTSLLLGEVAVPEALQQVPGEENLTILSAGPPPPNPSEVLASARAREVVASIARTAEIVVIDTPPVLPVSDALIVSGMVDATLVVANAKTSSRRAMHRSAEVLRQVDAPLVGTVLNSAELVETYGPYGYEDKGDRQRSNGQRWSRSRRRVPSHSRG